MSAYYNEFDPFAAAWLRELIKEKLIADGDVDDRSIIAVRAADLRGYSQCHFFAGIGGWSYALRRAGWSDARPVWTGSCPCQPFSVAGTHSGSDDERHLWPAWFSLISECRPVAIFGEQVASKDALAWLDAVYADLESAGYAVGAVDLCAAGVGAPHIRQRFFFMGEPEGARLERLGGTSNAWQEPGRLDAQAPGSNVNASGPSLTNGFWSDADWLPCADGKARPVEPGTFPLAHGIPARVGRLRGYGNAICTEAAQEFIAACMTL